MIDFGKDEDFIENYKKLKSSRKMAQFYQCDKTSVLNHAKKIGYNTKGNKELKITKLPPQEMIALYEKVKNCNEIARMYNCSGASVRQYLHKLGYDVLEDNVNNKTAKFDKEQFKQDYDELKSAEKMAKKYQCSSTTILNYAKKIGYNPNENKKYKLSMQDKQEIINDYSLYSSTELAKKYNVSRGMITKVWYDNGLINKQNKNTKTTEIDLTGQQFGLWTVLYKTNLRTASGGIYWHCKCSCGVERNVSSLSLRQGVSLSCGAHPYISKGNAKIKQLLLENNIPFETEKKFDTCKDKKEMPFDFFVDNRYLIEYDGLQHFSKNSMFDYEYTHNHDLIKSKWCKDNNIILIRIPYTHYNNLTINDLIPETSSFIDNYADEKLDKIGEA